MSRAAPLKTSTVYQAVNCTLAITRPAPGIVVLKFKGPDVGEFGDAPFEELARDLQAQSPLELYVDAAECSGASVDVSSRWAQWMSAHQDRIKRIHILCGSRFIELTAGFVRRFTGFEERMMIHTDHVPFDEHLASSVALAA